MPFQPLIAPEIFTLRPDFTALSLYVQGVENRQSDGASAQSLAQAIAEMNATPWADAHLEAWREAYRAFGAKPNRTPSSAEALRKRAVRDGQLRPTNAVVDLYNAVSLRYAIPVGGEDVRGYLSPPTLRRATGNEPFDTMADGAPKMETPDPGEVIWCDDAGVTCRRWNWRQGVRTQIRDDTRDMWFVLERLGPMPMDALITAGQALAHGLNRVAPATVTVAMMLDIANPDGVAISL